MRVLGIDYGDRRVGIALGDTESKIATPWKIVDSDDLRVQIDAIRECYEHEKAAALVVGVPFGLNGEEGEQVQKTRFFIHALELEGFSVHEADERLSSKLADTQAKTSGARGPRDDLAAANILRTWLERYGVSS